MPNLKGYAKGVALLTISALFVKVLSMIYRIPFQNLVGDRGFFIYQQVYPFVAIFMTWTSSGLAIAISKMLADEALNSQKRRSALSQLLYQFLWLLSVILFVIFYFCAPLFAQGMGDPHLENSLRIGAFVLFTMPALAMYKGSLQATGDMSQVAFIQVIEQVVRVAVILGGTAYVMSTSKSLYLAGEVAVFGTIFGEFAGVFLLFIMMRKSKQTIPLIRKQIPLENKSDIMKKMIFVSISASMSSLMLIFFQLIDSFTVFDALLKSSMGKLEAMTEKGIYDRGQPLVQVGLVIASSMSMVVVPLVANALRKRNEKQAQSFMQLTYQATLLFGVAATIGLILVMPYLNKVFFETDDLSDVLSIYVLQIIMLSVIVTLTAILQGIGYRKGPTIVLSLTLLIKLVINSLFVTQLGVVGAAWASNIALFIGAAGLIYYLKRVKKIQLAPLSFYKTASLASLVMYVVVKLWMLLSESITIFPSGGRFHALIIVACTSCIGAATFVFWITKFELFTPKQWLFLPMGEKMAKLQLRLRKN